MTSNILRKEKYMPVAIICLQACCAFGRLAVTGKSYRFFSQLNYDVDGRII